MSDPTQSDDAPKSAAASLEARLTAVKERLTPVKERLTDALSAVGPPEQPRQERLVKFLAQPLQLEETGPPKVLSQLLIVISVLVVGLIGFSAFTEINETAVVQGQVIPAGSVNLVQHLEGGIVDQILVEEGQIVERDQPLVRLQRAAALAELDQMRAREAALALRAERLRSFVLDRSPDFSVGENYPDLAEDQTSILNMQIEARNSQRDVITSRIEQRQAQLEALVDQKGSLEEQSRSFRNSSTCAASCSRRAWSPRWSTSRPSAHCSRCAASWPR